MTRQALADALRAGESNTSVGGASAVAGEPVAPAPVPPQYLCPITGELMEDPVTTADGHAYERAAIAQWLRVRVGGGELGVPAACRRSKIGC